MLSFFDVDGKDISNKPSIILDLLQVIGSEHCSNGVINVNVDYKE